MSSDTRPQDDHDQDLDLSKAIVDSLASLNYEENAYGDYSGLEHDHSSSNNHEDGMQNDHHEQTYTNTHPQQSSDASIPGEDKNSADAAYKNNESDDDLDLENAIGDVFSKFDFNAVHDNGANVQSEEEGPGAQDTQEMEIRHDFDISDPQPASHSPAPHHDQQHSQQEDQPEQAQLEHHYQLHDQQQSQQEGQPEHAQLEHHYQLHDQQQSQQEDQPGQSQLEQHNQHHAYDQASSKNESSSQKQNEHDKQHDIRHHQHNQEPEYQQHADKSEEQDATDPQAHSDIHPYEQVETSHNISHTQRPSPGGGMQIRQNTHSEVTENAPEPFSPHSSPAQLGKDQYSQQQSPSIEADLLNTDDNSFSRDNDDDFDLDAAIGDAFMSAFGKPFQHQESAGNKLDVVHDRASQEIPPSSLYTNSHVNNLDSGHHKPRETPTQGDLPASPVEHTSKDLAGGLENSQSVPESNKEAEKADEEYKVGVHNENHEDSDLDAAINNAFQSIAQNDDLPAGASSEAQPSSQTNLDQDYREQREHASIKSFPDRAAHDTTINEHFSSDQQFDDDLEAAIGNAFNSILTPQKTEQINNDSHSYRKDDASIDAVTDHPSPHGDVNAMEVKKSKTRKLARAIGEAFTDERADHLKKAETFKKASSNTDRLNSSIANLKQGSTRVLIGQPRKGHNQESSSSSAVDSSQGPHSPQPSERAEQAAAADDELTTAISTSVKQLMDNKQGENSGIKENTDDTRPTDPAGDIDDFMENAISEAFSSAIGSSSKKPHSSIQQLVDVMPHTKSISSGLRRKSIADLSKDAQVDLASIVQNIVTQMTNQDSESDLDPNNLPISQDILKELALEVTNHLQSVEDGVNETTTSVADLPQIDDNVFQHFQNEAHKDDANDKSNLKVALATAVRSAMSSSNPSANVKKTLEKLPVMAPTDNNEIDLESLQMNVILQNAFNMALENPQDLLSTLDMEEEDLSSPITTDPRTPTISLSSKGKLPSSSTASSTSTVPKVPASAGISMGENKPSSNFKDKQSSVAPQPLNLLAEDKSSLPSKAIPSLSKLPLATVPKPNAAQSSTSTAIDTDRTESTSAPSTTVPSTSARKNPPTTTAIKTGSGIPSSSQVSGVSKQHNIISEVSKSKEQTSYSAAQKAITPSNTRASAADKIIEKTSHESISPATKKLVNNVTSKPANASDASKKTLSIAETLALHRSSMLNNARDYSSIRDTSKLLTSPSVNPQLSQMLTSLSSHINSTSGSDNNLLQVIRQMTNALTSQKSSLQPFSNSRDVPSVYDIVSSYTDKTDRENMIGSLVLTRQFLKKKSKSHSKDEEAAVTLVDKALELFHASKSQITASFAHIKDESISSLSESVVSAIFNYTTSKNKGSFIAEKPSTDSPEYKDRIRLENRERKKRWREENAERNKDNDLRSRVLKRATATFGEKDTAEKRAWVEDEFNKRREKRIAKQKKDDSRPAKEEERKTSVADEDPKLVKSVTDIFDIMSVSGLKEEPKSSLVATSVATAATTLLHFSRKNTENKLMDTSVSNIMTSLFDSAVESGQTERFKNLSKAVFALRGESHQHKEQRMATRPSILDRGLMKDYQLTSSKPGSVLDIRNLDLNGNQKRRSIDHTLTNTKRQKSASPPKDPRTTPHISDNIPSISKAASDFGRARSLISSSPPSHLWNSTSSLKMPTYKSRSVEGSLGSKTSKPEVKEEVGSLTKGPTLQLSKVSPFISNKANFSSMKDDSTSTGDGSGSGKGLKRPATFQRPAYSKPKNRNLGFPPLYSASFSSN